MRPILVTGANGFIGKRLVRTLLGDAVPVVGADCVAGPCVDIVADLARPREIDGLLETVGPSVAVLAGAVKDLQLCESDVREVWAINVGSVGRFARYARLRGSKLVLVSSDMVFGGGTHAYSETALTCPRNEYGLMKVAAERIVADVPKALVCRCAMVVGSRLCDTELEALAREVTCPEVRTQSFFPQFVKSRLVEGKVVHASRAVASNTTDVDTLVRAIIRAITSNACGVLHTVGSVAVTRHELARLVALQQELDSSLILDVLPTVAATLRPLRLELNGTATYGRLGMHASDWDPCATLRLQ